MPSASATQENPTDQEKQGVKTKCPHVNPLYSYEFDLCYPAPCERTLLIDGKVKCDRCRNEISLAELQTMRLLNGETTLAHELREIEKQLPLDQDPPAHDRAREIMGDNFISLTEANRALDQKIPPQAYLELLRIPFSDELLEKTGETHWLMPVYLYPAFPSNFGDPLVLKNLWRYLCNQYDCRNAHDQWKFCEVSEQKSPNAEWMLIRKSVRVLSGQLQLRKRLEYIPTAAQLVYAHTILKKARDTQLIQGCVLSAKAFGPVNNVEFVDYILHQPEKDGEQPTLKPCTHGEIVVEVLPVTYKTGTHDLVIAKKPDLKD